MFIGSEDDSGLHAPCTEALLTCTQLCERPPTSNISWRPRQVSEAGPWGVADENAEETGVSKGGIIENV
jgi:hypothetical protein